MFIPVMFLWSLFVSAQYLVMSREIFPKLCEVVSSCSGVSDKPVLLLYSSNVNLGDYTNYW